MPSPHVPGVPIHHVPASTRTYLGSPSIVVLADGQYVVSLACLGKGAATHDTFIFCSKDRGETWTRLVRLEHQIWSTLFEHREALYLLGTDHADRYHGRLNGRMVIRRSDDGGHTWTDPREANTGLLADGDGYHTAPTAVIIHRGRVWKAMEFAPEPDRATWVAFVLSARVDADLLRRESWTMSQKFGHPWSESQWIEGNIVVAPDGSLADMLRTNYKGDDPKREAGHKGRGALIHVSEDGTQLSHDQTTDIIDFPGGGTKFTVRRDEETGLYWSLVNKQKDPEALRNALYLSYSSDLRRWEVAGRILFHPDREFHAFQYVDWVFEGQDIVLVSRTAYDDGMGGPRNYHDANYITFHRIEGFRDDVGAAI